VTTFAQAVRAYEKECRARDIPEETVMAYLVELSQQERYKLYQNYEEEMPPKLAEAFAAGMKRILAGEPMDHVVGYSWFYGYKLIVNGDVLIPRPETEELCAHVLAQMDYLFPQGKLAAADVGTGSGAIAITLAKEEPRVQMTASEISEKALAVARENAVLNQAEVEFVQGDMLTPLIEKGLQLDVLVSNPPYIPQEENIEASVRDYEPHVALFGGKDGLYFYRRIFADCQKILKPKSFMAFEIGWDERKALTELVQQYFPEALFEVLKDINGKDRILMVYFGFGPEALHENSVV
jgi:release factor glutamine methyltransferase